MFSETIYRDMSYADCATKRNAKQESMPKLASSFQIPCFTILILIFDKMAILVPDEIMIVLGTESRQTGVSRNPAVGDGFSIVAGGPVLKFIKIVAANYAARRVTY